MTDNVKLLEELVVEAADRLRAVTVERDGLREEVGALRQRLDTRGEPGRPGGSPHESPELAMRHARARELLDGALAEFRDDGDAA